MPMTVPDNPQMSMPNDSINLDNALELVGGESEMVVELFKSCQMEMPEVLREISDAIESKDGDKLRASAHKIKGTFIYVAADGAADLARQLEGLGRDRDFDAISPVANLFFSECEHVEKFIEQYLIVNDNSMETVL